MGKYDIPTLIPGDLVRYGDRLGTVKLSYPRTSDGKRFLMVYPADGKPEWAWKLAWEPLIHWTDERVPTVRCADCEREFRPALDEFGLRRIFCKTCDRVRDIGERARAIDASPSHQFGARVNRARRRE